VLSILQGVDSYQGYYLQVYGAISFSNIHLNILENEDITL